MMFVDELPRTATGKLLRRELRAGSTRRTVARSFVNPCTSGLG